LDEPQDIFLASDSGTGKSMDEMEDVASDDEMQGLAAMQLFEQEAIEEVRWKTSPISFPNYFPSFVDEEGTKKEDGSTIQFVPSTLVVDTSVNARFDFEKTSETFRINSITCMDKLSHLSFEELRWNSHLNAKLSAKKDPKTSLRFGVLSILANKNEAYLL
jgi:hypothetical protein